MKTQKQKMKTQKQKKPAKSKKCKIDEGTPIKDVPYTDAPVSIKYEPVKAEEPKAEEPKAEEPKAEEPKAEEPKAEEPKDAPADGQAGVESEPVVDPTVRIANKDDIELALTGALGHDAIHSFGNAYDILDCLYECHFTMLQLGRLVNSGYMKSHILPWDSYERLCSPRDEYYQRPGRILSYSADVAKELQRLSEASGVQWSRPESPYLVGMLHMFLAGQRFDQLAVDRTITPEFAVSEWIEINPRGVGAPDDCGKYYWSKRDGWETVAWIGARLCKYLNEDEVYSIVSSYTIGQPYAKVNTGFMLNVMVTQAAVMNVRARRI